MFVAFVKEAETMSSESGTAPSMSIGDQVIGKDGRSLGRVREIYPHYILAEEPGEAHLDLEIQTHAISRIEAGVVHVSITRDSASPVDDAESAHRTLES